MLRSFLAAENISVFGLFVVPGLSYRLFWDWKERWTVPCGRLRFLTWKLHFFPLGSLFTRS